MLQRKRSRKTVLPLDYGQLPLGNAVQRMILALPGGKKLELLILSLRDITPHEELIPSLLSNVKRDMSRTGFQRDPILIDLKTKVILDGMHRRAALESLGARFALCAAFNYTNHSVHLERWLRYFIAPDKMFISKIISLLDLRKERDFRKAMKSVDRADSRIALLSSRESYVSRHAKDFRRTYRLLSEFDSLAMAEKVEVQFHPEEEKSSLLASESVFVIYPPPLEKNSVVKLALGGGVFPFKTTRHVVPIRPMGAYFPLNLLKQSNINRCNQALRSIIHGSRIELLEKNSWYEGRRYTEPLAVFRKRK